MYYKSLRIFFLIIPLLLNAIALSGCESQQEKEARLSKEKAEKTKDQKEYLEQFYRKDAVLLSLKYKVDEEKIFNILVEEKDLLYKDVKEQWDLYGEKLKERIERYSGKYNIPTDIVASILIDYEAMNFYE